MLRPSAGYKKHPKKSHHSLKNSFWHCFRTFEYILLFSANLALQFGPNLVHILKGCVHGFSGSTVTSAPVSGLRELNDYDWDHRHILHASLSLLSSANLNQKHTRASIEPEKEHARTQPYFMRVAGRWGAFLWCQ